MNSNPSPDNAYAFEMLKKALSEAEGLFADLALWSFLESRRLSRELHDAQERQLRSSDIPTV